jgi:ElaB/YqjD/DUF883 family membrane-anchored ribosome-binding protein
MANDQFRDPTRKAGTSSMQMGTQTDATDEIRQKGGRVVEETRQQVERQVEGQKDRATEQLGRVRTALEQTSDNLRDQGDDAMARYVGQAARRVEDLSGYLRNRSVGDMISAAEYYARREPALFLGGAMLIGLLGARFLKSSSPSSGSMRRSDYMSDYQGQGYRDESSFQRRRVAPQTRVGAPYEEEINRNRGGRGEGYRPIHGTSGSEMPSTGGGSRSSGNESASGRSRSSESPITSRREGNGGRDL